MKDQDRLAISEPDNVGQDKRGDALGVSAERMFSLHKLLFQANAISASST